MPKSFHFTLHIPPAFTKTISAVLFMTLLVSCHKIEFKPSYSAPAFQYLNQVMKTILLNEFSDGEKLDLAEGWQFHGWDTLAGKEQAFPDFLVGNPVKLPHRITQPNSNIWYSGVFDLAEGYLKINGDDGTQLWCDGERIYQNENQLYPVGKISEQSIKLSIRVINNAVSGGLKQVTWVSRGSLEDLSKRKKSAYDSAVHEAKKALWLESDFPTDWKDYPIWLTDPVLLPHTKKDSLTIRWLGEKNAISKIHYGREPGLILQSAKALEKDGIYTAVVPRQNCSYYYFEMDKTQSPLFTMKKNISQKEISFSVWADSQGGWETFSRIINQMKINNPDFTIGVGDLVGNGAQPWQYIRLLDYLSKIHVPHRLFAGNHDYDGSYDDWNPIHFNRYLKTKNEKTYSFWREGPCAFIALDPNAHFPVSIPESSSQFNWFTKTIQSESWKSAPWKIVLVHQPPYSQGWIDYQGEKSIRELLKPFWESGLIDLVISGHTHDYERLIIPHEKGKTAFVIVGGAGGGFESDDLLESLPEMDTVLRTHHFGWIKAGEERLEFHAMDLEGNRVDGFTLLK
ncbi:MULTISPECIES: metallophosphoesterase family protein [Rhodonellum]|nr:MULTISPECIES: metallophosphoesterase [Rhodonellum]SDZ47941.1 Calcineurin-like phosphoesterase [Rhodonellum ikkaensis]